MEEDITQCKMCGKDIPYGRTYCSRKCSINNFRKFEYSDKRGSRVRNLEDSLSDRLIRDLKY